MSGRGDTSDFTRVLTALDLAIGFAVDRESLGLGAAVERLRIGLKVNGLWLGEKDEALMSAILNGQASDEEIDRALSAAGRAGADAET
jgi:hypothetical protein